MDPGNSGIDWRREVRRRLRIRIDPEREADIVEELAQDLEQRFETLRGRGFGVTDAERQLLESLEDGERLSRNLRRVEAGPRPPDQSGWAANPMPGLLRDFRLAGRMLIRNPAFAAVAILTLTFGIGANLAMFSVVYAALWRPLPFAEPRQLVHIHETRPNGGPTTSNRNRRTWQQGFG